MIDVYIIDAKTMDYKLVGNLIIKSTNYEIANIIDKYGVLVYSTRR